MQQLDYALVDSISSIIVEHVANTTAPLQKANVELRAALEEMAAKIFELEAREPLRGEKGEAGLNGKDGADGVAGRDGIDGASGKDGADGANGKDGEAGPIGPAGKDADFDRVVIKAAAIVADQINTATIEENLKTHIEQELAGWPKPQDGKDGLNGKDGADGKDGEPGLDGDDGIDGVDAAPGEPGPKGDTGDPGIPGRDGRDGVPGPEGQKGIDGKNGIDGKDGFSLTDLKAESDGERTVTLVFEDETLRKEIPITFPFVLDRGVYKAGETYAHGDGVTFGGSFFIAQTETKEQPEKSKDWRLAVKRGRDGKDGSVGPAGQKGEPGKSGRDLTQLGPDGSKW